MLIKQSALLNLSVEKWSLILCILPQKQSHEQEQGMMRLNLSKFASSPQDKRQGDHALKEQKSSASLHCWAEREQTLVYYFYPKWQCWCYSFSSIYVAISDTEAMQSYGLYGMPEAGKLYRHWADATLNLWQKWCHGICLAIAIDQYLNHLARQTK